jgi:DNA mismatch repair protein MutS2
MIHHHALETLEFPKVRDLIASNAVSALGRERIENAGPRTSPADVQRLQTLADEMSQAVRFDDPVPMRGVVDIRTALETAQIGGSILGPERLLDIAQTADAVRKLRGYFESRSEKYPHVWDIASALEDCRTLVKDINAAIEPSGRVADSASPTLARTRRELDRARISLRSNMEKLLNRFSDDVVSDRVVAMRDGRPTIPVRASNKHRVTGIVHDQSATGQTIFIEPIEAVEQSNAIRQLELDEMQEIERILLDLSGRVREHLPLLIASVDALVELDALYAIGQYAAQCNGISPRISTEGTFDLREMRHPLLDARLRALGDEEQKAIPLTCVLEEGVRLAVISGPNAGGKTVTLKTLGLAIAMTQAGFPIPADHLTVLPVFSGLFAEIGDEQSLDNDLSTFSSRMLNLAKVCNEADENTFVLVDELGSATDPDQGAALARAILATLAERGTRAVVTTHLGNLKEYAHENEWARNASMEFNQETLRPTFRLLPGIPGSSYALEISRRVGVPADVIARAEQELGEDAVRSEALIADLTSRLEELHRRDEEMAEREERQTAREIDYSERFSKVNTERKRLRDQARTDAEKILGDARSLMERTVADLRKTQGSTESIKKGRREIQEAHKDVKAMIAKPVVKPDIPEGAFEVGDWVRLTHLGLEGELVALSRDRATVQTDSARLEAALDSVEKLKKKPKQKKVGFTSTADSVADTFRNEIDVRGQTFDEAWGTIDRYIDDAAMVGFSRVRIIHGKGTGALRMKLTKELSDDPRVLTTAMGAWNEGGAGVTNVEVKI